MSTPEGKIQLSIIKWIKARGWIVGKTKTMGTQRGRRFCFDPYTFRGFPDLCAFIDGQLYFIEVKSPKGKQSPEQFAFQKLCEGSGLPYILARSVEDVQMAISEKVDSRGI